jgi:hypothetical protein
MPGVHRLHAFAPASIALSLRARPSVLSACSARFKGQLLSNQLLHPHSADTRSPQTRTDATRACLAHSHSFPNYRDQRKVFNFDNLFLING